MSSKGGPQGPPFVHVLVLVHVHVFVLVLGGADQTRGLQIVAQVSLMLWVNRLLRLREGRFGAVPREAHRRRPRDHHERGDDRLGPQERVSDEVRQPDPARVEHHQV